MRAGTRKNRFGASAGVTSEKESNSAVVPTTRRLPKRETRAPTSGIAARAPTAAPSRAMPSKPSPRPSRCYGGYPDDPGTDHDAVGEKHPEYREPGHAQRLPVMFGHVANKGTCGDGACKGASRTAPTGTVHTCATPTGLVLKRNIPSHVALDCAVVDDAGCGHVLQCEALACKEGYVLAAATARYLSGDDLAELVDGLGEDGAGLQRLHQVACFETELFARVGAHEARPPDDLAVDLGLEQEVRPCSVDVRSWPEPLAEEHGLPR